ncbi:hypothetical protein ID866_11637 [Astraeus odoratus]|nr:hypothetical protein ID866_11637 [Astraeus odoratus]
MATRSLVPTPSVPLTRTGSWYSIAFRSKVPPKPPISASDPLRFVKRTNRLILLTRELPAPTETPASA